MKIVDENIMNNHFVSLLKTLKDFKYVFSYL